mgnify:CR=1 FL=1
MTQKSPRYAQLSESGIEKLNRLWKENHPEATLAGLAKLISSERNSGKEFTNKTLRRIRKGENVEPYSLEAVETFFKYKFTPEELGLQEQSGPGDHENGGRSLSGKPQVSAGDDLLETSSEMQADSAHSFGSIRLLSRLGKFFAIYSARPKRDRLIERV